MHGNSGSTARGKGTCRISIAWSQAEERQAFGRGWAALVSMELFGPAVAYTSTVDGVPLSFASLFRLERRENTLHAHRRSGQAPG